MKKFLLFTTSLVALLFVGACATTAEKAEREAARVREVAAALADRHYQIDVRMMHPMRGKSKMLSYGYSVEVKGDTLVSYLPYFGRAYNVPYGGGKALNFTAPIRGYREGRLKKGLTRIEIATQNEEDQYLYTLDIFDNGRATIDVVARERENIRFDGEMKQ